MLLVFLTLIYSFHARYVTDTIRHLCRFSMPNAMLCSTSGVFSKVVMLLESDTQNIDYIWAGNLLMLLFLVGYSHIQTIFLWVCAALKDRGSQTV